LRLRVFAVKGSYPAFTAKTQRREEPLKRFFGAVMLRRLSLGSCKSPRVVV